MSRSDEVTVCPKCLTDLEYEVDGHTYSKVAGVEVRGVYDGALYWAHWQCFAWQRWPENHRLYDRAQETINIVNKEWSA